MFYTSLGQQCCLHVFRGMFHLHVFGQIQDLHHLRGKLFLKILFNNCSNILRNCCKLYGACIPAKLEFFLHNLCTSHRGNCSRTQVTPLDRNKSKDIPTCYCSAPQIHENNNSILLPEVKMCHYAKEYNYCNTIFQYTYNRRSTTQVDIDTGSSLF